jgi:hypothetical protein
MGTESSLRLRRIVVALVTGGLVAGAVGVPASADRRRTAPDRPWSGFRIDAGDRAADGWLGARKIGSSPGRVVYRIDPSAETRALGFTEPSRMTTVPGPGGKRAAGARATARAAWILSKYGSFKYEIQSAAVDAAVLHLLAGPHYSLNGDAGSARLRETGQGEEIRRFASIMLHDSIRRSGPYRLVVRQLGETAVGDPVRLGVQAVVGRSGVPLTSVPVAVRVGDGPWQSAGETDDAGVVGFDYVGRTAGPQLVTARVARVPEHRLLVMEPRRRAASRVAVAGRKHVVALPTMANVKARPAIRVSSGAIVSGNRTLGSWWISRAYGSAAAAASVVLHGPFGSFEQISCQRKAVRTRQLSVMGSGHYRLPRLQVRQAGVYVWRVVAAGNAFNLDASACAGAFRVRPRD